MNTFINNYTEEKIAAFWENHPCGVDFIEANEWETFFKEYDNYKFSYEPHILEEIAKVDFKNKKVLEIGLGQGAEAQKIIEKGAIYNGIDITTDSVSRVKLRCKLFNLPYESIRLMNGEEIDFSDNSFDIIFSHGVIHHSPRIEKIVAEIFRLLKPEGKFIVMVYHKNSVNYRLSIMILRRVGIIFLYIPGMIKVVSKLTREPEERLIKHFINFRKQGINYLKASNFIHKATDGPDNIYSSVYSEKEARQLFKKFRNISFNKHLLNERHLPIIRNILTEKMKNKLSSMFGWHLWIKGIK